ncbi:hypothetical protein [Croceimicrobium hydrocarbonivorans]|uniref:Uncharacterized protein n=1 Tax=Croceimicrobium hydrocarbonivorans TaxID=2761580 RepID=A0A7H0VDW3_9FLAO|nr:hypothetical protein [Croceimicrobium hydrocarbonivorans]QNR23911.1 hypothetical protein H4K34_16265 [Croceimicrobium hydrocarbonivorans]
MIFRLYLLLLLALAFEADGQKTYFKSIDYKRYNDSIKEKIDQNSDLRISYHFSSYWLGRRDTLSSLPDLFWNSSCHIYSLDGHYFYYFISPYLCYGPIAYTGSAPSYFLLNDSALFNTDLRTNQLDYELDSLEYKRLLKKGLSPKEAHAFSQLIITRKCADCPGFWLQLKQGDQLKNISEPIRIFNSEDPYYSYNSQMKIYTFFLLLKEEQKLHSSEAEEFLEFQETSHLKEEDRIQYLIELKQKELKRLKNLKTDLKNKVKSTE